MDAREYWAECLSIAADEIGLSLTAEQINELAEAVKGGHENFNMAFGYDVATNNRYQQLEREKADAKQAAERERRKIHCRECNGHGRIEIPGPYHSSNHECHKCGGAGRHDP